ncbi:MAG: DUF2141 domain-containing protein [Microscillaceae bacterium]|nr:DUF2141 domain-containing protein [Microscillaceae bacterium]MDW8459971.1 DUF2141 domain-containing protein [Cytophagales bacterium]
MANYLPKSPTLKSYLFHLMALLFILLTGFEIPSQKSDKATLILEITDIRSNMGKILLSVFNTPDGFPAQAEKAHRTLQYKVTGNTAIITIPDLPMGEYAIAILHDEDNNGKMNRNFLGVPKEGYGASNDARNMFSPPDYEKAKFLLNTPQKKMKIKMMY